MDVDAVDDRLTQALGSFDEALAQLSSDYQAYEERAKQEEDEELATIEQDLTTAESLRSALHSLAGVKVLDVAVQGEGEREEMHMAVEVKRCAAVLVVGADKTLSEIKIKSPEFSWINAASILEQCRRVSAPNDLRQAVFMLGTAQEAKTLFQKHTTEFRKLCIVQYFPPLKVKFTFKNGMTATVQARETYPQMPGSVQVTDIQHVSLNTTDEQIAELQRAANSKWFCTLSEVFHFLDASSNNF